MLKDRVLNMHRNPQKLIDEGSSLTPSLDASVEVAAVSIIDGEVEAIGVLVASDGPIPEALGLNREALVVAGFDASLGSTLKVAGTVNPLLVLVGLGSTEQSESVEDAGSVARTAAAAFGRAVPKLGRLAIRVPKSGSTEHAAVVAQAIAEGLILARYRLRRFMHKQTDVPLAAVMIEMPEAEQQPVKQAIIDGVVAAQAANIARDLTNLPPGHLTPHDLGETAAALGARFGFKVELFGEQQLIEMGCGGILGVGSGSVEESMLIKLDYMPESPATAHLGLVGKGITYDSGGISLKPSDAMHLLMKMDMGGAAAVLAAFTAFRALGVSARVTGWLACAENMPSGSSYRLGDVLTARGGTTVEIKNTDAEGRIVMMDALVLATEENVDAVVDIATLTGAAMRTFGNLTAALFGNDDGLVAAISDSAKRTDEQVWRLPLERQYRKQLDSGVADIANLGGPNAGSITAALFLQEFVDGTPWAHLDIAGTMQSESDDGWRSRGATGFGTRLLIDLARHYART